MNWNRNRSAWPGHRQRPQTALERIDAFLERDNEGHTAEMIQRVRKALFGVLPEEREQPAEAKLPE